MAAVETLQQRTETTGLQVCFRCGRRRTELGKFGGVLRISLGALASQKAVKSFDFINSRCSECRNEETGSKKEVVYVCEVCKAFSIEKRFFALPFDLPGIMSAMSGAAEVKIKVVVCGNCNNSSFKLVRR